MALVKWAKRLGVTGFSIIFFVNLGIMVAAAVGVGKIGGVGMGTLVFIAIALMLLSSLKIGGVRLFPMFVGRRGWQAVIVAVCLVSVFMWGFGKERLLIQGDLKKASERQSVINTTSKIVEQSMRKVVKEAPFYADRTGTSQGIILSPGSVLYCTESSVGNIAEGEPLISCMMRNEDGYFVGGKTGFVPVTATVNFSAEKETLLRRTETESNRLKEENGRLQSENSQLKNQLANIQAQGNSSVARIADLEKQLAKRDVENGELRSQLTQAEKARRTAEQAQRNAEEEAEFYKGSAWEWKDRFQRLCKK